MSDAKQKTIVGKLDVASRQVTEAIRLLFGERDLIAVHTLAAAAHQILVDLAHKGKNVSVLKGSVDSELARDREYLKSVNFPFNFFKHARSDADERINVAPLDRLTHDFLMDNVLMLQQRSADIAFEAKVYWAWYVSRYADEFDDLPTNGAVKDLIALDAGAMSFPELSQFIVFNEVTSIGGDS
jgi:hypothetical protein